MRRTAAGTSDRRLALVPRRPARDRAARPRTFAPPARVASRLPAPLPRRRPAALHGDAPPGRPHRRASAAEASDRAPTAPAADRRRRAAAARVSSSGSRTPRPTRSASTRSVRLARVNTIRAWRTRRAAPSNAGSAWVPTARSWAAWAKATSGFDPRKDVLDLPDRRARAGGAGGSPRAQPPDSRSGEGPPDRRLGPVGDGVPARRPDPELLLPVLVPGRARGRRERARLGRRAARGEPLRRPPAGRADDHARHPHRAPGAAARVHARRALVQGLSRASAC